MFNKLKESMASAGNGALQSQMATIQKILKEQVGPKAAEYAADEAKMTTLLKNVYTVLPAPIRLAVNEEKFVKFCFEHKDQVLAQIV